MTYRTTHSLILASLLATRTFGATDGGPADVDWLPVAAEVSVRPPAVPIVPLPPAVYGSAASLGLIVALRYSRHRWWLTLRR